MYVKKFFWFEVLAILIIGFFQFISMSKVIATEGASLYLEPAGGSFVVGGTFSLNVVVNTSKTPINIVEVDLHFPPDKLQVVSPTTGVSFFKILLGLPTFSNSQGTINIKGGLPSPGIITDKGLISTVTFRVKSTGQAAITFSDESKILADDGKATNILTNKSGSIFNLILPPPAGPNLISPTHSDQQQWYHDNAPLFSWSKDVGVTGFSFILNKDPIDIPDDIADNTVPKIRYHNIEDGRWFFHLKAYSPDSGWGGTSHYQVLIDKTPPASFLISTEPRARTAIRRPFIIFTSTDNLSGIDHYELKLIRTDRPTEMETVKIDNVETPFFIEATSPYQTPELDLGKYDVLVRAFDKAGNFAESQTTLIITNLAFEPFNKEGFGVKGIFMINWPIFWTGLALLLVLLFFVARHFWSHHRDVREKLANGWHFKQGRLAEDINKLKELRKRYF